MFPILDLSGEPFERGLRHGQNARVQVSGSVRCYAALFASCGIDWAKAQRRATLFRDMGWAGIGVGMCFATASTSFILALSHTTVANITPTLNISAPISSSSNLATAGLVKVGNGVLQLSGASLFGGGVDVQAGGLAITQF